MATAALSICVAAVATPRLVPAFSQPPGPANDAAGLWTAEPRAVKLLASCVALPPVYTEHRARFGNSVDKWAAHVGYRVEALEAIRMEVGDRLMQAYHQHGDAAYEPFRQWCETPSATDAITAAIAASVEA